jgi:hypothetical protein
VVAVAVERTLAVLVAQGVVETEHRPPLAAQGQQIRVAVAAGLDHQILVVRAGLV